MNKQQGVGTAKGPWRCSGNGLRDLVPAYVNNPGQTKNARTMRKPGSFAPRRIPGF
jgi:hypothetical protein